MAAETKLSFDEAHLADLLSHCAQGQAGITFYREGSKSTQYLSYSDLQKSARIKARYLEQCDGVSPSQIILLHFQSHLENVIWFWASILAGCVPAMSTPFVKNHDGRLSHLAHLHQLLLDPLVLTSPDLLARDFVDNTLLRVAAVETEDVFEFPTESDPIAHQNGVAEVASENKLNGCSRGEFDGKNGHLEVSEASLASAAVLMLTSGSTGHAKAVRLTHNQIFTACKGKLSHMPLPEDATVLNWIGLDHVGSLVELHLTGMLAGCCQVYVPASTLIADSLAFLRLLSTHKVVRTFAPNFFLHKLQQSLDAATAGEIEGIDLHHLLYLISGGEPNNVETCVRISTHLRRLGAPNGNTLVPGFGMTETCAGSIYSLDCPEVDVSSGIEFASLGTCVPGIEMRIQPAVPGANEGTLEVHGPIVFQGYFNNETATQEAFTHDGWFRTGDLATIDTHGVLRLTGRSKDFININGVKYLPNELESTIEAAQIPGVACASAVCIAYRSTGASSEQVYVVYQQEYDPNDFEARMNVLQSILKCIILFTGARPLVLPLEPGRLERTTLGKVSRAKIRTSLMRGDFHDQVEIDNLMLKAYREKHAVEPNTPTEKRLRQVFQDMYPHAYEMGINTPLYETGVSSVDIIRLKRLAEEALQLNNIPITTIMSNTTIRSLATAIENLQASQRPLPVEYEPVIALQPNGAKTPLWLIHPGIGEMLIFLGLVRFFPDRPIYAMRARGFNEGERVFSSLDEIVTCYYHSIKKSQPAGPYALAGYSYGSMIAFELAKRLERNADIVQFLGSFNLPPHIKTRMQRLDWTAGLVHIAQFCRVITEQRAEELLIELRPLTHSEQVTKLLVESDQQQCFDLALTHDRLENWTDVSWSLQKIGWEYDPSGTVSHLDVFYCQPLNDVASTREEYRSHHLNHWVHFIRDDLKFWEVDGQHYTMIGPDHVSKFQQTLKRALKARCL